MPSKEQADILIAKYFETVDDVYPFLHRRSFYADYERFWALSLQGRGETDASFSALLFAMYALGTQFVEFPSYDERSQTAEFYCSAANQALRVYSYLNRTSMRAIQAMLLMSYFLMNDNHASGESLRGFDLILNTGRLHRWLTDLPSDAYAFAGIHLRQAYAMRLHRDPDIVASEASQLVKQQRRKLWQAVFFHDTFLTVLLKLPPTATHSDVPVESLREENEMNEDGLEMCCVGEQTRVENLMSIAVIAPQPCEPAPPAAPHHIIDAQTVKDDIVYQRCMWHLGNLVQENLSSPFSLSLPLANNQRHKDQLVAAFRRLHKSFPPGLTQLDYNILKQQCRTNPRGVRQNLFLISNYYHCLMLLYASENQAGGVECQLVNCLEAAHQAIWSYFKLRDFFEAEAGVWWVFQHRAFEESLLIAHLLAAHNNNESISEGSIGSDPIFAKAKEDVARMLDVMEGYSGGLEVNRTRREVLQDAFGRI